MTESAPHSPLEACDITVSYSGRHVVRELSFRVPAGCFTAMLGPNGCGKSTLLRALAGLHPPETGRVLLDGHPLGRLSRRQLARRLSMLPQAPRAPEDITVRDLVEQGRYPHRALFDRWSKADEDACGEALALTGLSDLSTRPLAALSGGQRQRAWIAMTLAQSADILLLDEPTTYLDLAHQLELLELVRLLVRERGKTVLAVLHDVNQATQFADMLVMLKEGRILHMGRAHDVMSAATMREVFSVEGLVTTHPLDGSPLFLPAALRHARPD